MPPAMILCGGQGSRLRDVSELLAKPMVPVGPQPILWHIMKIYAAYGVRRFILCLGYKRESIIDYSVNYRARSSDLTVKLGRNGGITFHGDFLDDEDWEVTLADTGEGAMTGARVLRASRYLRESDREFFLTYGDGVADVDVGALLDFHRSHRQSITVTAVHPAGRFGEITVDGNRIIGFHEKPQTESGLINGGFLVLDRGFVDRYLPPAATGEHTILEEAPMRRAAAEADMAAWVHAGFWQCMDTPREHHLLNQLWDSGSAPWTRAWPRRPAG